MAFVTARIQVEGKIRYVRQGFEDLRQGYFARICNHHSQKYDGIHIAIEEAYAKRRVCNCTND